MKFPPFSMLATSLVVASVCSASAADLNTLTDQEKAQGWRLLWDGKTTEGWRGLNNEKFPTKGWGIKDGVLLVQKASGGGDIITVDRFSCFELTVDFKISPGANSGIKYFIQSDLDSIKPRWHSFFHERGSKVAPRPVAESAKRMPAGVGHEFQLLDDARHPDAKLGHDGDRTIGSLYDLIAASKDKKVNPVGEWNTARIVVTADNHIEHWLNGEKVVDYVRGSDDFKKRVAASKFKAIAGFGEWANGHILIQDHGDAASFRNLKIRVLP